MAVSPDPDERLIATDADMPRWPRRISIFFLLATIVTLVATVAWTRLAGWLFLVSAVGWLVSSLVQGAMQRHWRDQRPENASLRASSTTARLVRFVAFVVGGIVGAAIAAQVAKPAYSVYAGFVLGGTLALFVVLALTARRSDALWAEIERCSAGVALCVGRGLGARRLMGVTPLLALTLTPGLQAARSAAGASPNLELQGRFRRVGREGPNLRPWD